MKKTFAFILALILSASLSIRSFAEEVSKTGCRDFTSFFDADELTRVLNDTANDTFMCQMAEDKSERTLPYKRYDVTNPDFIYRLADGEKLADMISSEYRWIVPGKNSVADVVMTEENKWHTIGYATYIQESLDDGSVQKDIVDDNAVNSAIEKLSGGSADEIEDVICVHSTEYFTDFVCVVMSDKTHLIPFGSRPDFTGLANGTVYSPNEATEILLQTVDVIVDDDYDDDVTELGGLGVKLRRPKNNIKINLLILIFPAAAAAVATVVYIVVRFKAKKQ